MANYQRRARLSLLCAAQKLMSNYTNHLANKPTDKPFQKFEWPKADHN